MMKKNQNIIHTGTDGFLYIPDSRMLRRIRRKFRYTCIRQYGSRFRQRIRCSDADRNRP